MTMKLHLSHKGNKHSSDDASGFFHRIGRDPYTDWAIIFTVTVIVGIVFVVLGFFTFEDAHMRLNANPAPSSAASVKFNAQALTSLLSTFDARATERAKLEKSYGGPGDPSI
jgi:hypothetical protein